MASSILERLAPRQVLTAAPAESLDQLWHEAASLGSVRVWQSEHDRNIEVTITFKRRSGTKIEAKGNDQNIAFAMGKAINEAREMGAGEPN